MRPPICEVCGRRARATVGFADYRPLPPGGPVGHPVGLGWFCWRHLRAARSLEERPLGRAIEILERRARARARAASGLLVAAAAVLAIRGHYVEERWLVYLFKPLTTSLVLALAARRRSPALPGYRTPIVIGLLFSLLGDVMLMIPGDWFLAGLASFAVTHVCYLAAFRVGTRLAARRLPFLLLGSLAVAVLVLLWPGLDAPLRLPVVAYAALLAAMAAQATARALAVGGRGARIAAAGALLFLVSDTILALDRFRVPFEAAHAVVLGTYFTAQWLIALSVERDQPP